MRLIKIILIFAISLSLVIVDNDSVAASGDPKSHTKSSHKPSGRSKGKKNMAKTGSGDVWLRIRQGIRIPRPSPVPSGFGEIPAATAKNLAGSVIGGKKRNDSIHASDGGLTRLTTVIKPKKFPTGEFRLSEQSRVRQVLFPNTGSVGNDKTDSSPEAKYTPLGRIRFAKKEAPTVLTERSPQGLNILTKEKSLSISDNSLFKSPSVQRIRTRLGLHPELFKDGHTPIIESITKNSATDKKSSPKTNGQHDLAIRNCADLKNEKVIGLAQQGILPESYSQMAEECRVKQDANVERVNKHIAGYSQHKGFLHQVSEQARPYLYHIVEALGKYGLPLDLALLPIVESAYQPTALSPKSAAGIWQFIPSTGNDFGLEQNYGYDARLDVTASTQAAVRFLSGLNAHYKGDWLLALAAYNCGQGAVDEAISRNQAEGLDTDYWSLDLPAETQDYVPRLLALAAIFANPDNYGLNLRPIKNEPYFIKVNIDREADIKQLINKDLKTIAKFANFDPETFSSLNSAYLKGAINRDKPFTLLMPISNANLLHQSLAFMAQSYKDEKNSTALFLSRLSPVSEPIGSKIQTPLLSISPNPDQDWFTSIKQAVLLGGQPTPTKGQTKILTASTDNLSVHYLDKGETLKAVAEDHGISEVELREINKFKRRQPPSFGQRLLVPLKKIVIGMALKKNHPSVLYKGMATEFNPLSFRL